MTRLCPPPGKSARTVANMGTETKKLNACLPASPELPLSAVPPRSTSSAQRSSVPPCSTRYGSTTCWTFGPIETRCTNAKWDMSRKFSVIWRSPQVRSVGPPCANRQSGSRASGRSGRSSSGVSRAAHTCPYASVDGYTLRSERGGGGRSGSEGTAVQAPVPGAKRQPWYGHSRQSWVS